MALLPVSVKHTSSESSLTMVFDRPADAKTAKRVVEILADRNYESDAPESHQTPSKAAPVPKQSFIQKMAWFWCKRGHE